MYLHISYVQVWHNPLSILILIPAPSYLYEAIQIIVHSEKGFLHGDVAVNRYQGSCCFEGSATIHFSVRDFKHKYPDFSLISSDAYG